MWLLLQKKPWKCCRHHVMCVSRPGGCSWNKTFGLLADEGMCGLFVGPWYYFKNRLIFLEGIKKLFDISNRFCKSVLWVFTQNGSPCFIVPSGCWTERSVNSVCVNRQLVGVFVVSVYEIAQTISKFFNI